MKKQKQKKTNKRVMIAISQELHQALREKADKEMRSVVTVTERLLRNGIYVEDGVSPASVTKTEAP